ILNGVYFMCECFYFYFFFCFFFFFFFQAEDGIRDYKVTGVQTCALPISELPNFCADVTGRDGIPWRAVDGGHFAALDGHGEAARSEERRVGKECRSRWWPDH